MVSHYNICLSSGLNSGITDCVGVTRMGLEDFSVIFFRLRSLVINSIFPVENLVPVIYRGKYVKGQTKINMLTIHYVPVLLFSTIIDTFVMEMMATHRGKSVPCFHVRRKVNLEVSRTVCCLPQISALHCDLKCTIC